MGERRQRFEGAPPIVTLGSGTQAGAQLPGKEFEVHLPFCAHAVSRIDGGAADGVHLLWFPPLPGAYSVDGFDILRRESVGKAGLTCHELTKQEHETLRRSLRVDTPIGDIGLRKTVFAPEQVRPPDEAKGRERKASPNSKQDAVVVEIDLRGRFQFVSVSVSGAWALGIAWRGAEAVASAWSRQAFGEQALAWPGRSVDRVSIYLPTQPRMLRVCREDESWREKSDAAWGGARAVASGLQMPLRRIDPALGGRADELSRARGRLIAGESMADDHFGHVSAIMNATVVAARGLSECHAILLTRKRTDEQFVEIESWPFALTSALDPAWRRAMGLGFLDTKDLKKGRSYDYRIVGRFRKRDIAERFLGFYTVPTGTRLPRVFSLEGVRLQSDRRLTVEHDVAPLRSSLQHVCRRGVRLDGRLLIDLPEPVLRLGLDFDLRRGHSMRFRATASAFVPLDSSAAQVDVVPEQERVVLEFEQPVSRVSLEGRGFLLGLRPVVAEGDKANGVLSMSADVFGVVYEPTPPPEAPSSVGVVNLQTPPAPFDPDAERPTPAHRMGFRVAWLPAEANTPWPQDIQAHPPFESSHFLLERRRVDDGGAYKPIDKEDGAAGPVRYSSHGESAGSPGPLYPGVDLLEVYPERSPPTGAVTPWMQAEDVLWKLDHSEGPPPGSTHRYRVWTVDVIGRRSANARESGVVRLEKRVPPPSPVEPTAEPPPGVVLPSGVRARALQAADSDLSAADRALLAGRTNAVVIEWGWRDEERRRDPHAKEFRVYWQPSPTDVVRGELLGPVSFTAGAWTASAQMSRAVKVDEFVGRFIVRTEGAFRIAGHSAGALVALRLEPWSVDPSKPPDPGPFMLQALLSGEDLRPAAWAERVHVEPIDAHTDNYRFVLHDRLALSDQAPRTRAWIGVSAADDQPYISDETLATAPNGGRPGNESSIAPVTVEARYLGRPVFTPPPPLSAVPETRLDEPVGDKTLAEVDVAGLLPGVVPPAQGGLLVERVAGSDLLATISARADDAIGVTFPGGVAGSYTLANAGDHAALLGQIRGAEAARIESRFLLDLINRFGQTELGPLWQRVTPRPVAVGTVRDQVPASADRFFYRVRVADAAGHPSSAAAVVPRVYRVPSLRRPGAAQVTLSPPSGPGVPLTIKARDAFDLAHLLLFVFEQDAADPPEESVLEKASLKRVPNRLDLYPGGDGIRVELPGGRRLAPRVFDVAAAPVVDGWRTWEIELLSEFDRRVAIWCASLTRDGAPSKLVGPFIGVTAQRPPQAPALSVAVDGAHDTASWGAPAASVASVGLERSVDGGATWARVSPWLPPNIQSYSALKLAHARRYRLAVRSAAGVVSAGPAVPLL